MATSALDSMPLGYKAPFFELENVATKEKINFFSFKKKFLKGTCIIFLCAHCPYVKHILPALNHLAEQFMPQGIGFLGISANDPSEYHEDRPEGLAALVETYAIPFPVLFDETQEIAKAYSAIATPDFFLFDNQDCLVYHGRLDGSTHKNGVPLTGEDLKKALEALVHGGTLVGPFTPSLGCSIKWKQS